MNKPRIPIALQQAVMRCLRKAAVGTPAFCRRVPRTQHRLSATRHQRGHRRLQSWEIRLNPVLLLENQQPFIDEVVPHELAHLLVFRQFGRVAPHGREWRWMMESVLLTPPAALTVSKPPRCKAEPSLPLRLRAAPAHHPPP